MKATLKSIGYIQTPYKNIEECPSNVDPSGPLCQLVIAEEYIDALTGLEANQQILILYWLEKTNRNLVKQTFRHGDKFLGTFALRSPHRPNPIGAAVLSIEKIEKGIVFVKGIDCLDGTDLIDIKPAIKQEKN
ncbi:tRNA (N6-threonylcarbamoyladenosine(37)-N6)-methyltransferase TrmO [Thiomicrorhabdus hydrogeniphila]